MTQGKNAVHVKSTLPAVAAEFGDVMDPLEVGDVMDALEVGDVMDALEVGEVIKALEVGGDGVGAGPVSNAKSYM